MSVVFKKFFAQTLSDAVPIADLRRIAIETDPTSERATRLRSIAQDVLTALRSVKCVSVIPAGTSNTVWLPANLAYALAETRHSICLVEANLRRPRLASVFDLPPFVTGLADVLSGKTQLDTIKHQINSHLTIIPGGDCYEDVIGFVASARLDDVLRRCSESYSLTMVLCPPSADYLDYTFISRFCEGGIIIAQKDKCRMADASRVKDALDKLGLPLLYALLARGPK